MAKVTVLYWQGIPSVVEAKDKRGKHKIELSQRFQALIDLIAMKELQVGTDQYLEQWNKGRPDEIPGDAMTAAVAVAEEIESRYENIKAEALKQCGTWEGSPLHGGEGGRPLGA